MGAITRISWRDLLTVKFSREGEDVSAWRDCWWQFREVARRAGLFVPECPMREAADATEGLTPVLEYVGPTAASATRIADAIIGDPTHLGWPSHVATIVDERARVALSTSKVHGPFAWPALRHPCEYGVWRPKLALDGSRDEELESELAAGRRAR